jgi:hypothetical protein
MKQFSQIRLVRLWASINTHTLVVKFAVSTPILHQYFSAGDSYITEDTQPNLFRPANYSIMKVLPDLKDQ